MAVAKWSVKPPLVLANHSLGAPLEVRHRISSRPSPLKSPMLAMLEVVATWTGEEIDGVPVVIASDLERPVCGTADVQRRRGGCISGNVGQLDAPNWRRLGAQIASSRSPHASSEATDVP